MIRFHYQFRKICFFYCGFNDILTKITSLGDVVFLDFQIGRFEGGELFKAISVFFEEVCNITQNIFRGWRWNGFWKLTILCKWPLCERKCLYLLRKNIQKKNCFLFCNRSKIYFFPLCEKENRDKKSSL